MITLALLLLACSGGPAEAPDPPPPPSGEPDAAAYASRGAPSSVADWDGPWTARVYAPDPQAPGPQALTAALGVPGQPWTGARPPVRPGEVAVVWVPAQSRVEELMKQLSRAPGAPHGPAGAVVVVLEAGADPAATAAWRQRAAAELPWADLGVVDPAASGALYGAPSPSPGAAGGVAALVLCEAFDLELRALQVDAPPGLAERLGIGASAQEDPRTREALVERAPSAEALQDPEAAVRLALARSTDDPALLRQLAQDPEPLVRARAADRLRDPAALATLVTDPSSVVRLVATQSLAALAHGGSEDPQVGQALIQAAASGDAYQRWKAAYGLGPVPEGRETLLRLLQDVDIDVQRQAASALGKHRGPEVTAALVEALSDPNSFVRRWAARGLGELQDASAIPALERAAKEPTALVAEAAVEALRRMGREATPPRYAPPDRPQSDAELERMIADPDATVRKDVSKFLAGRADAERWLLQLAEDKDSEVRKSAVEALSYSPGLAHHLSRFTQDPDPDTLVAALDGIRRTGVGEPEAVAALLTHSDTEIRLRAAEALAELHQASPLPEGPATQLAAMLTDPDERVRAAAARAFPTQVSPDEPALLVLQIAAAAGVELPSTQAAVRWVAPGASPEQAAWARGILIREDELVHLRFSWNDPKDRPASHRALRPPLLREYGHPNRG
ncbi:MAG: HEAT repeat domain-containing protein [Alphaproteobacteria bacterium]|nr:HEAT repeat domain-containing protein [Alphaproteobacteria bacterium]